MYHQFINHTFYFNKLSINIIEISFDLLIFLSLVRFSLGVFTNILGVFTNIPAMPILYALFKIVL